jgi:hypothetical protein
MQTDAPYRHRYQIDQVLVMLTEKEFKQTIDEKGTVSQGLVLYYRHLDNGRYLLFSHHNAEDKNLVDGFDCRLASFQNERQIGQIKTQSMKDIRLSFKLASDYALIAPYLEK